MSFRTSIIAAGMAAGLVALTPQTRAAGGFSLSGALFGEVHNNTGAAQMGAAVFLYNRYDQLVRQTFTSESGKFVFDGLASGSYSIHVILASFLPAVRSNIVVAPGSENLLRVNLGTLFSGIEVAPPASAQGALMSDEWKWVLRTSAATRPVLRLAPVSSSGSAGHRHLYATFTDTTGLVRLATGDGGPVAGSGSQNIGTAFAISTRVNGASQVRVSGDFGYIASSGLPITAVRGTYSRDEDGEQGPEIAVTVHQIDFPGLGPQVNAAAGYSGSGGAAGPELRTLTMSAADKLQVNDQLQLEYEAHADAISFTRVAARVSPFIRATYDLDGAGALRLAYSSGSAPTEILNRDSFQNQSTETALPELSQDLAALAMLPSISRDGGAVRMQRDRNFEAGYQFARGSRKYYASIYHQSVYDGAFNMSASPIFPSHADLLPALDGSYYVFDIGNYRQMGYTAAVTQSLGGRADFTLGAGRSGDLLAAPGQGSGDTPTGVRSEIQTANRYFIMARASASVPGIATRFAVSYGWAQSGALMPTHYSLTGPINQEQGLNIGVRQPLPHFTGARSRLEATAELRNALAQGYLPVTAAGRSAIITDSPRSLRGGLSFLF